MILSLTFQNPVAAILTVIFNKEKLPHFSPFRLDVFSLALTLNVGYFPVRY